MKTMSNNPNYMSIEEVNSFGYNNGYLNGKDIVI